MNGRLVSELPLDEGGTARWSPEFDRDSFVTVEVVGRASDGFEAVLPGSIPFAFTNPIFVDADGDGEWTAPGLGGELPLSLTAPLPKD